jgi:chromosome partitioning protein
MRTVAVCAPKGGSGKTTTTLLLAVHAANTHRMRVGIIDLNADQPSIANWLASRSAQKDLFTPELLEEIEDLVQDVKALAISGTYDLILIDTPPVIDDTAVIEGAVAVADAVLIPCRPSALDVGTMDAMVEICREHRKPFAFLLSDVTENWRGVNNAALEALTDMGGRSGRVMAARVTHKIAHVNAMTIGKTGPEIDPKLGPEIRTLWSEVAQLAGIETPEESGPSKKGRRRV